MAASHKTVVNANPRFKKQIPFEIKQSLVTVFIFALGGLNFVFAKEARVSQIYFDVHEYGWAYFVFSIFLMLMVNDIYFYWTHRLLHRRRFFGKYHSIHHRSKVTTPWTSQSFHWVESVINVFIAVLFPYMFPLHPTAYIIFTFVAFINNVYGHGNHDFVPVSFRNRTPFNLLNSPSIHGYHHENVTGNYGLYTNIWDRLHGTYINPDERKA
ncbi:MAG: sterol desaturase family protein [Bdellovibrionaceae bacterium]|nr:sterol desaturase family protein [Bdellovibrio sp.]